MTEIQKSYRKVITAVDGRKGITFEKATTSTEHRIGSAGMAIAVSVLDDGNIEVKHLLKRIPDFTQTEIRTALKNLRQNKYFVFSKKEKLYRVALGDTEEQATDGIVWALLGACANGWLQRANKEDKKAYVEKK